MVNWVKMNFGQKLNIIMMLLLEKFGKNPVHGSRENSKMVVDDGGSFLENSEYFDLKLSELIHITFMHLL
jgi:hypothetical protein